MNNLKISTRLSGAFALLVLMLVGLAVAAMTQLSAMRAATAEISDNWLPSVAAINALEATSADLRLTILAHVLSTDDAAKATIDKQIVDQRAKLAEMRKGYEKLISSPAEKKLYDDFATTWNNYVQVNNRALALSRSNDSAGAAALMSKDSRPIYLVLKEQLDTLVELNNKGATEAKKDSESTYTTARNTLLVVAALAIALAIAAALWLIRSITAPCPAP